MQMLRSWLAGAAAATALLSSTSASAAFIGFEDFGNVGTSGPVVTNQYAAQGVVFSSTPGEGNQVSSQAGLSDGLNFICTGNGSIDCTGETILTFASGASGLSFLAVGSNSPGVQALVDVYVNNAFAATQGITVGGNANVPGLVDLSAYNDITSIRIYDITDPAGLGWDDFSFKTAALVVARRQRRG